MNSIQFTEGENVIYVARRHSLAFIIEVIFIVLGGVLPHLLYSYKEYFSSYHFLTFYFQSHIFIITYLLWVQFLLLLLFIALSDHYLDAWIVTSSRIIDIEQKGTLSRTVSSLTYDRISDITTAHTNPLEKVLRFGTLCVKRNDSESILSIGDVFRPHSMRDVILAEQRKHLERLAGVVRNQQFNEQIQKETAVKVEETKSSN